VACFSCARGCGLLYLLSAEGDDNQFPYKDDAHVEKWVIDSLEVESDHSALNAPRSADNRNGAMSQFVQIGLPQAGLSEEQCLSPAGVRQHIVRLQAITLVWMVVECGVSLGAAVAAHSPALLAFGSDSFVELLSAVIVLLQFLPSFPLNKTRAAQTTGVLLFLLAAVVAVSAVLALVRGVRPETSFAGIGITAAALIGMPILARKKRAAARATNNRALAADAVQSAACAYLAAVTLLGLAFNAVFHLSWVDSGAALVAIPILVIEGRRAMRGESCGCC